MFAPFSSNSFTMASWPLYEAVCNAVAKYPPSALTFAPFSTKRLTIVSYPAWQASSNALSLSVLVALTSAPFFSNSLMISSFLLREAVTSGRAPSKGSGALRSTPISISRLMIANSFSFCGASCGARQTSVAASASLAKHIIVRVVKPYACDAARRIWS